MKEKKTFYCELAYILGILALTIGNTFMARADFGMSMVVAPAYIIHLKVSQFASFYTFGVSGYVFQLFLLVVLFIAVQKIEKRYFLSFVTALIYAFVIDVVMIVVGMFPYNGLVWKVIFFISGLLVSTTGVALLMHAKFPPEAYDLFVKEVSRRYNISLVKVKTVYDCCSCVLAVALSLIFFGAFVGVNWGTIVCALTNGFLIGKISGFLERNFVFKTAFLNNIRRIGIKKQSKEV